MIKEIIEEIKVIKMKLPNSSKYFKLNWNDEIFHNLYNRIKDRTELSRKETVKKIIKGLDLIKDELIFGTYIIFFKKSNFKLIIFKEKDNTINIKTILSKNQKTRPNDRVLSVNEILQYFNEKEVKEIVENRYNTYFGNILFEEDGDKFLAFIEPIEINL